MKRELISGRTLAAFREFLVSWTLREIDDEFRAAYIECDEEHAPLMSGQRRCRVEQYYATLDLAKPTDARRCAAVFESILRRSKRQLPHAFLKESNEREIEELEVLLLEDGLRFDGSRLRAVTPEARLAFEFAVSNLSISEVTRRAIFDEMRERQVAWAGQLQEDDFVSRLFDLESLPSHDPRFETMAEDHRQHRIYNPDDWNDDWIFMDDRLKLLSVSDEVFLAFLALIVHPAVRPDVTEAKELAEAFNRHLALDGWGLKPGKPISGRPTYEPCPCSLPTVDLSSTCNEVLSVEYIRELDGKCDDRLARGDLDGAVTLARTLVEAILRELEMRLSGAFGEYKGDLAKQFKAVSKLLSMDDTRPDLNDSYKAVVRGLVGVVAGLAPLRNKVSDGHARVRKPPPHHARMIVNASRAVSVFLVESYSFQLERGVLQVAPAPNTEVA